MMPIVQDPSGKNISRSKIVRYISSPQLREYFTHHITRNTSHCDACDNEIKLSPFHFINFTNIRGYDIGLKTFEDITYLRKGYLSSHQSKVFSVEALHLPLESLKQRHSETKYHPRCNQYVKYYAHCKNKIYKLNVCY